MGKWLLKYWRDLVDRTISRILEVSDESITFKKRPSKIEALILVLDSLIHYED